jgi:CheY-like chemotaxis protein
MAETILVVDDDPDVRALARDALVSLGYVVLETGDPQHALRLAKEHFICSLWI